MGTTWMKYKNAGIIVYACPISHNIVKAMGLPLPHDEVNSNNFAEQ